MNRDEQFTEWIRDYVRDQLEQVGQRCRLEQPLTMSMTWNSEELQALQEAHDLDIDVELVQALAWDLKRELSDHLGRISAPSAAFSHLPPPVLSLERPSEGVIRLTLQRQEVR